MSYPRNECLEQSTPGPTDVGRNTENMFYTSDLAQG